MGREQELFGKLCRDKVTGFKGVCTGKITWMYGCDQYCLTPRVKEGEENKLGSGEWFDDGRVEIIEECVKPQEVRVKKNGGVHDKSYYPSR